MSRVANPHAELAKRFKYPHSKRFLRILELLLTPEEAEIALEFQTSATKVAEALQIPANELTQESQLRAIAKKLNMDEKVLKQKVEAMAEKGALVPVNRAYLLPWWEVVLHDENLFNPKISRELCDAWQDFAENEWYVELGKEWASFPRHEKVIPAYQALKKLPKADVVPEQDMRQIIADADQLVIAPCVCRVRARACDKPVETCLAWGNYGRRWLKRGTGRAISKEQAIDIMAKAEDAGLIHTRRGMFNIPTVCQCDSCCCDVVRPLMLAGKLHEGMVKSAYMAVVDPGLCTGCQDCVERCIFDAMEMRKPEGSKKLKAFVDPDMCFGCGSCVVGCPADAISLKLVRPPVAQMAQAAG